MHALLTNVTTNKQHVVNACHTADDSLTASLCQHRPWTSPGSGQPELVQLHQTRLGCWSCSSAQSSSTTVDSGAAEHQSAQSRASTSVGSTVRVPGFLLPLPLPLLLLPMELPLLLLLSPGLSLLLNLSQPVSSCTSTSSKDDRILFQLLPGVYRHGAVCFEMCRSNGDLNTRVKGIILLLAGIPTQGAAAL